MLARLLRLHPQTYHRLIRWSREAEREGVYRVAKRLQAVVLNSEGRTSGDLARILKAPRSKVSEWLARYTEVQNSRDMCSSNDERTSSLGMRVNTPCLLDHTPIRSRA